MTKNKLGEYFAALERLKSGKPQVVPRGSKICNDTVSIEAGRSKGSIKKSRAGFALLINAIKDASMGEALSLPTDKDQLKKNKIR